MASTFAEDRESWQSQPAENELNDEELDIYFGSGRTETVGVRYYSGIVSDKEMVTLVREPGNPYDTNAIRVNNTMGQQIGHIPRQVAAMMAPLLDSALLRVDAIIPFGSSNAFKIPLDVHLYGKREGAAAAHKVLRMLGSTSINFHPDTVFSPQQLAQAQAAQQRAAVAPSRYAAGGGMLLKEDAKNLQQFYTEPMPYDDMPAAAQPAALQSTLYLHQRKGLWWMMQREQALNVAQALDAKAAAAKGSTAPSRPTAAAAAASAVAGESAAVKAVRDGARAAISAASQYFFWERRNVGGRILYFNTLTGSQYAAPPALFRGGMLSDEMGLGKTLTTIALIVAQKAAHPARSGPTLIVAPKSVLGVWREEILRHTVEGTLRVHVYHNEADGTSIRADELAKFDVVLTTYTTVQMSTSLDRLEAAFKALEAAPAGTEAATAAAGKLSAARQMTTQSVLQRIRWHRVVLDEAHVIKEQKTKQSRACHLLDADIRWCLTGTPIQNKLMDMFTLVRFLRAAPFDDRTRWDALIVRPIRTQDVAGFRTLSALMAHVCLRRTKDQRVGPDAAPLITLPPAVTTVRRIPLAPADRERYDSIAALLQEQFEEMRKNSTLSGSYTTVMTVLIRLRQLACHSALVPAAMLQATIEAVRGLSVAAAPQSAMTLEQATALVKSVLAYAQDECPVCMELPSDEDAVVTPCAHMYCKMCKKAAGGELGDVVFTEGDLVAFYSGRAVPPDAAGDYVLQLDVIERPLLSLDAGKHGPISKYINGASAPRRANVRFSSKHTASAGLHHVAIVATRDIRQHEELLVFYGKDFQLVPAQAVKKPKLSVNSQLQPRVGRPKRVPATPAPRKSLRLRLPSRSYTEALPRRQRLCESPASLGVDASEGVPEGSMAGRKRSRSEAAMSM